MDTPVSIILDLAAVLSAVLWPLAAVVIALALRKFIPEVVQTFSRRVTRIGIGGFSLELAEAKVIGSEWTGEARWDLRRQAAWTDITDSTQRTFAAQLQSDTPADYAVIDLGTGGEWLTSRLYIMAILFTRINGLRAFVFLETTPGVRKRLIGWAEPQAVRWALARRYPEYERAYAEAYAQVLTTQAAVIVNDSGRLGEAHDPESAAPGVSLLQAFLTRIQNPAAPPADPNRVQDDGWQVVNPHSGMLERADWIDGGLLEKLLGAGLHTGAVVEDRLRDAEPEERRRLMQEHPGIFVPLVDADRRFVGLVSRDESRGW